MYMKLSNSSKIIIAIFTLTITFWLCFIIATQYTATYEGWKYQYLLKPFLIGMTILPLIGGLLGLKNALSWGGTKSVLGKSVLGVSLGLIAWAGGMVIWNYYLFFTDIEVPYPSLADAIFILSWPLWTYGLLQLSRAIGVKFGWRNLSSKKILLLISGVVILLSTYLIFGVARDWSVSFNEVSVKLFFDLFYPVGSIVISTLVLLIYWLSKNFLGGIYKTSIIVLFLGFLFNYVADFTFSLTTTNETYFNGHFVDFMFTVAMFTLSLGLSMLNSRILNIRQDKK